MRGLMVYLASTMLIILLIAHVRSWAFLVEQLIGSRSAH
jgi:hypothetical protein